MTLEAQINLITVPQEFSRLCTALFRAQYGDGFLPIDDDQPDAGNDGYLASDRRMLAMHCFKRPQNQGLEALIRRKMVGDLGKAIALKDAGEWEVSAWTFVSNYPIGERVGATMLRMGSDAGIAVSWLGPAELALMLQANPSVQARFPQLQVNDVSQKLERLHDRVVELARDLTPDHVDFTKVPRTPDQQARLVASRPECWEYLLFGGVLLQGREALESMYLDHKLGIAWDRERADFTTSIGVIRSTFDRLADAIDPLTKAFQVEPQQRAFGPPGTPGNARAIEHLAGVVIDTYETLLTSAGRLHAVDPPKLLDCARTLSIRQIDGPINAIRDFIDRTVIEMERLPARVARREEVELTLALDLEPKEPIGDELGAEMKRVAKKVRWQRWTGLDIEARRPDE